MLRNRRLRPLVALMALSALLLVFNAAVADARGGGSNSGSLGLRMLSVPPTTRTAPNPAAQINRSATQTGQVAGFGRSVGAPPAGVLNRPGLLGGLAAGFLGAGLFGLLIGNGIAGGLGGIFSIVGLILQIALIVLVLRLVWIWWRRRHAPAFAELSPRELADAYGRPRSETIGRSADLDLRRRAGTDRSP